MEGLSMPYQPEPIPSAGYGYTAFGLKIHSDIELPMLEPLSCSDADLTIRLSDIPEQHEQAIPVKQHAWVKDDCVWLRFPGAGEYWIKGGGEIRALPPTEENIQDWYFYLLGAAVMCALTQRGCLPLHACAVEIDGSVVLLLGATGSGKSTLALYLDQLGFRVLSDDMSAVYLHPDGGINIWPAYPYAKLDMADDSPFPNDRLWSYTENRRNKNLFRLDRYRSHEPGEVGAAYILKQSDVTDIQRITPLQATRVLVRNTHRDTLFRTMQGAQEHLKLCSEMIRRLPVFRFSRSFHNDTLAYSTEYLLLHIRSELAKEQ